jgi:hypothetical protein
MKFFKKTAIAAALAVGVVASGAAFADATISSGGVTASINDGGTFTVTNPGPGDGTPGLSFNGVEFINIDNPSTWWWLKAGGVDTIAQYNSNPLGAVTESAPPAGKAATTYNSDLSFDLEWTIVGSKLTASLNLTNTTGNTINDIWWGTGFDPDQGGSGNNATNNYILGQLNDAAVLATVDGKSILLRNTTSSLAYAIGAYVNTGAGGCCAAVDPSTILPLQTVGYYGLNDDSISLSYYIGSLAANETATIGWEYVMAVPEPETYAMLLAGLGLMGFVARRRRLKATA